jgi:hypothetical protein
MLNALLFSTCYIGGFVLAIFRNPIWAFMVYQIVYFMNPTNRWWSNLIPTFSYSYFSVILMIFVFFRQFSHHNKNRLLASPQFKWIYLIALAYLMTLMYAALPYDNKDATINFVKLVIIISIAYKLIDSETKLDYSIWAYIAGCWYVGFITFQVGRDETTRVENVGTVDAPDANGIAAAIVPALVLCLYYFWMRKNIVHKFLFAVSGAFVANAVVLINSRAAFLAAIVSTAYFVQFVLFSRYQVKYQRISAVGLIIFGLIGTAYVVDETAYERFLSINKQDTSGVEQTGATRVFFWFAAWDMARDHPFGAGAKGFEYYAPAYVPENIDTGYTRNRSVHSTWFEALTDIGFLGLFGLVMLLLSCFRATKRCKKALVLKGKFRDYYKIVAIESALIAFVVAMTFMNRLRAEILYWCVLYTACAYNIYVLRNKEDGKTDFPE